ncbi:MAG: sporulation integral membrane protein YtvI [Clostridium sp.]
MEMQKRRQFIINFLYFGIIFMLAFVLLKYGLPMVSPFAAGFVIACILRKPVLFLAEKLPLSQKAAAVLTVLLFYCTIGILFFLTGVKAFSAVRAFFFQLPELYTSHVEPVLNSIYRGFEESFLHMDPSLLASLEELVLQFSQSLGQLVSSLSGIAMGWVSGAASSLPGLFISLLLLIISTFFIAADYETLTGFCLRQLSDRQREMFLLIKEYVVERFGMHPLHALIMSITFIELSVGLTVIGVKNPIPIALLISIFDILPVLGTGGIMIPWIILEALTRNFTLSFALLAVYLFVTVVRNILEPKIVGTQIGLHPIVTLSSMFVGTQLFGVIGLFGFPIVLSLLRYLNEKGMIHLFHN